MNMKNPSKKIALVTGASSGIGHATAELLAKAVRPRLRYTAGRLASRLTWLRRFAPARLMDAGIRKDLRLDATLAVKPS